MIRSVPLAPLYGAACLALAACSPAPSNTLPGLASPVLPGADAAKISHVVYIVQENRSFDDLFQGYPGADTVSSGKNSHGKRIRLQAISLKVG